MAFAAILFGGERRDYWLVATYTAALYVLVLCVGGPLTMHEGVLSQTTRAMLADHDWLVPHYANAPWLERPPLPQWISCGLCFLLGHCDQEWQVRLGAALAGLITVLLTVWLARQFFGRGIGIFSGLILATMYNFVRYSTLAEADIFLAPIVAGALCAFARMEILAPPGTRDGVSFFGRRCWPVLVFFVLLGMTNLAKGLVFGTVITLAPVGGFLLWNLRWRPIARYCWLWGWLAFFAVALPWPLLVMQRYGDAFDLWYFDLYGRFKEHYLEEPAWYYFACLLWVPQPWTIAACLGLGLSWKKAWQENNSAQRFVWCWAWLPICVFSLSHGKHHHYMLHYLAPWAMLAAQGAVWLWQRAGESLWLRRWAVPVVLAASADLALALVAHKLPGPSFVVPVFLVALPLFLLAAWWFALERRPAPALTGCFALLFIMYATMFTYKGFYLHRSRDDTAFLYEARRAVPPDRPLMLNSADEALEGLRMQFYIGDSVYFLHNLSFIRDDRIQGADVYVVTRFNRRPQLEKYGRVEALMRCKQSRREQNEADRWTLFRVHLREGLQRKSAGVRISPMQAMYRAPGPDLD